MTIFETASNVESENWKELVNILSIWNEYYYTGLIYRVLFWDISLW